MLLLVIAAIVLSLGIRFSWPRITGTTRPTELGWMSQQWLAEHRMSHKS